MSGADVQLEVVEPPRRRRWWLWALLLILGAPLSLCIGGCGLWWYKDHQLRERIAAIRERGEPVTAEDLDAFYVAPPPEQDATELWTRAGVLLEAACQTGLAKRLPYVSGDDEIPAAPPPGTPWNDLPLAEQFLRENALAMQLLHDAAKKGGGARYQYDFEQVFALRIPELHNNRYAIRSLALEANVSAHQQDPSGTAAALQTGLVLVRSMEFEPDRIAQFIRLSNQRLIDRELRLLLPAISITEADLVDLQNMLLSTDYQMALHRVMQCERAYGLMWFEDPTLLQLEPELELLAKVVAPQDMASYLSISEELVAISSEPWPRPLITLDRIYDFDERLNKLQIRSRALLMFSVSDLFHYAAQGTADARITGLAIALERYRRAHGRPPARLADLSPEFVKTVPTDPHTGEPFHYETTADGYVVYSLGAEAAQAGINTDPETGALESLVFRYPPKPWEPPKLDPQFDNPFDVELEPSVETEVDPEETSQPSAPGSTDQEVESNLPREDGGTPDPETSP